MYITRSASSTVWLIPILRPVWFCFYFCLLSCDWISQLSDQKQIMTKKSILNNWYFPISSVKKSVLSSNSYSAVNTTKCRPLEMFRLIWFIEFRSDFLFSNWNILFFSKMFVFHFNKSSSKMLSKIMNKTFSLKTYKSLNIKLDPRLASPVV